MEKFEPIPIPELEDNIRVFGGGHVTINRDNAEIVRHKNFAQMDHVRVRDFGRNGLYLFNIDASPVADEIGDKGYDVIHREYPTEMTQRTWLSFTLEQLDQEIEQGKGHEIDD